MKISWGHKIAAVYMIFVAGIVFLVLKANNQSFDLVTKDYYGEELKFQDVIDASGRTASLTGKISVKKENEQLTVSFPSDFNNKKISGELMLYCPSDERKDFKKNFETDHLEWTQKIPLDASGLYTIKLKWTVDNKNYYYEENIFI